MIPSMIGLFLIFLCWGSFLNVVGYRIIRGYSLLGRSFCPHCRHTIAWHDLIPILSWLVLQGRCRNCRNVISPLYPLVEFLTAMVLTLMIVSIDKQYWLGYGILISALMVTLRTDFEKMLISRYMTLALIPVAFLLIFLKMLPLTPLESITGALFGYLVLWIIARLFYLVRKIQGMGVGDMDLLSMIGAFTGMTGAWSSLLIGSWLGTLAALVQMLINKRMQVKIAFGPWLAAGALIYLFFQDQILLLINTLTTY